MELAQEVIIEGKRFQLQLIDPFESIGLDVRVAQLCTPLVSMMGELGKASQEQAEAPQEPAPEGEEAEGATLPEKAPEEAGNSLGDDLSDEAIDALFNGFVTLIKSLKPSDFSALVKELLDSVTYMGEKKTIRLADSTALERKMIFGQNLMSMYRLVFEVARFNKFLPFALGDIGALIQGTPLSQGSSATTIKKGLTLGASAGLRLH